MIQIVNLTRPFTVNQLKEMLKRTGSIEDFWIDRFERDFDEVKEDI